MPAHHRSALRVRLAGLAALGAASMVAACSQVPVSGGGAAAGSACTTPGPANRIDSFSQSVQLITASDGLKYGDIAVGCGSQAQKGRSVTVQYTGWLSGGKEFDSSRSPGRQPFTFVLGGGQVITGFDEGILGMRVGGKRRLVVPPALAYGSQGYPPVIPPNASLYFDVELIGLS